MTEKTVRFPDGGTMPALCLGTWYLGEKAGRFAKEVDLLETALDAGVKAFDVSESYGDGGAELVVGEAVKDCRPSVFLCSKIVPDHASYDGVFDACGRTLERLGTDYLDMYLLHWRGSAVDLSETLEAFAELKRQGLIKRYGVSNFDMDELKSWMNLPFGKTTDENQVLYNLFHRSNADIVRLCRQKKMPVMTYFPYESTDGVFDHSVLREIARRRRATPYQIALAWSFSRENTGVLLKAKTKRDLKKAVSGTKIRLDEGEIRLLEKTFP